MPRTKGPNPIDTHVGSRVRMRRMMLGISQEKLAEGSTEVREGHEPNGRQSASAGRRYPRPELFDRVLGPSCSIASSALSARA
jgi:hypothetical protein